MRHMSQWIKEDPKNIFTDIEMIGCESLLPSDLPFIEKTTLQSLIQDNFVVKHILSTWYKICTYHGMVRS